MTEHMKAVPDPERELIVIEMDRKAYELWRDHEAESTAKPRVHQKSYQDRRDRIVGLFFAVASQMGWWRK